MHAILPKWADVKKPHVISMSVYTGRGRWSHAVFRPDVALGGRGYLAGAPPIDWDVCAGYHLPT
jgi:hypothetical protein